MTDLYEQCSQDILAHRSRQEELARHVEDLVAEVRKEREACEQASSELTNADRELRKGRRALKAKESALQSAFNDLAPTQSLLTQRESDLGAVQCSLQDLEFKSKRLGETHTCVYYVLVAISLLNILFSFRLLTQIWLPN
jgi:chromosome segregation ATPase